MTRNGKIFKLFVFILFLFCLIWNFFPQAAFAEDSSDIIETSFFGNLKDDGKGCGVYTILNLVVDILSIGVGILGVIGIMLVGIRHLTAGGNEQQAATARRRIAEIVIGLVLFAVLYPLIQWLLPGGKLNGTNCETISDSQLSQIKKKEQEARQKSYNNSSSSSSSNNSSTASYKLKLSPEIARFYTPAKMAKLIRKGKLAPAPVCTNCTWGQRIAETAKLLSWPRKPRKNYSTSGQPFYDSSRNSWSDLKGGKPNAAYRYALDKVRPHHSFYSLGSLGADCGNFVNTVLRYSGHDRKMAYGMTDGNYFSPSKNWKQVKTAKPGDVCVMHSPHFHTWIYLGDGISAEASHPDSFGHISKKTCSGASSIWRAL